MAPSIDRHFCPIALTKPPFPSHFAQVICMTEDLTLEQLKSIAQRRGLTLTQDELQKLLPGVIRARKQAVELRELLTSSDEPAGVFNARSDHRK